MIFFIISPLKSMLWVFIRIASFKAFLMSSHKHEAFLMNTHNICFYGEIESQITCISRRENWEKKNARD